MEIVEGEDQRKTIRKRMRQRSTQEQEEGSQQDTLQGNEDTSIRTIANILK